MRIAYVSSSNHLQSGAELWMLRLAEAASKNGDDVHIISASDSSVYDSWFKDHDMAFPVHPVLTTRPPRTRLYQELPRFGLEVGVGVAKVARFVQENDIDVVHVNELLDAYALIGAKLGGAATVCHVRVVLEQPSWVKRVLVRTAQTFADRIVCVSEAVRELMFGGDNGGKVIVSYDGGPDREKFRPRDIPKSELRSRLNVPRDAFVLTAVGKLAPNKGHHILIQAMARLRDLGVQDVHLLLVGRELLGYEDYTNRLQGLIQDHDLESCVSMIGFIEDIRDAIEVADVFVHVPIHHDPFPGVVLEAMSMAKPVIGSRSGGIPEQIEDGRSGVLVPRAAPHQTADAIVRLHMDSAYRGALGRNARKSVQERFSREEHFEEIHNLYSSLF